MKVGNKRVKYFVATFKEVVSGKEMKKVFIAYSKEAGKIAAQVFLKNTFQIVTELIEFRKATEEEQKFGVR